MQKITDLFQTETDPVVILGGGPTLIEDLALAPCDSITIGVNHHGWKSTCHKDYFCFLDHPDVIKNKEFHRFKKPLKRGKRVSTRPEFSDFDPGGCGFKPMGDSGIFATWFGCYLTSGPVYLCGFTLRGEKGPDVLKAQLLRWKVNYPTMYHPERIVPVSGPLKDWTPPPESFNLQLKDFPRLDIDLAVLGGGPSLPEDLEWLPEGIKKISVNHHAHKIADCQMTVFLDDPENQPDLQNLKGLKICYYNNKWTDYYSFYDVERELFQDSGQFAVWVASHLTTGKIYLAGFDLYDINKSPYFHENNKSYWGGPPMPVKLEKWIKVFQRCKNQNLIISPRSPLYSVLSPLKKTLSDSPEKITT